MSVGRDMPSSAAAWVVVYSDTPREPSTTTALPFENSSRTLSRASPAPVESSTPATHTAPFRACRFRATRRASFILRAVSTSCFDGSILFLTATILPRHV